MGGRVLNETINALRPWGRVRRSQSSGLRAPTRAPAPWPRAQNSPKMLADTKQAEPSRLKTRRAKAISLGPSGDEGVEGLPPQSSRQGAFIEQLWVLAPRLRTLSEAVPTLFTLPVSRSSSTCVCSHRGHSCGQWGMRTFSRMWRSRTGWGGFEIHVYG